VHMRILDTFGHTSLGKPMHREEVCDLQFVVDNIFNNPGPHNIVFGQQKVHQLLLIILISKLVLFLLLCPKLVNGREIFLKHGSQFSYQVNLLLVWQFIQFIKLLQRHIGICHVCVLHFDTLCRVEKPIHIVDRSKRRWKSVPRSHHSLVHSHLEYASMSLLLYDLCKSF